MPKVPFDKVSDDIQGGVMPAGVYRFQIVKVRPETTKNHDDMWTLELKVFEGDFRGWTVWDRLVFVEKAYPRIKMLYKQLGLPVDNSTNCEPDDIRGSDVWAEIIIDKYEGKDQNKVTFGGYHSSHKPENAEDKNDLPF